jgi:acetyltransferase-like isoleucine patch superfamily enzyme
LADYPKDGKLESDDQPVKIAEDVWVGAGAIILKGVIFGRGAIIVAAAVVNKNVPPYAIAGGVPAKIIKYRWNPQQIMQHEELIYSLEDRLPIELILQR